MREITLTNHFHGTMATVRPDDRGVVSQRSVRRARKQLCPWLDCQCGQGEFHERPSRSGGYECHYGGAVQFDLNLKGM